MNSAEEVITNWTNQKTHMHAAMQTYFQLIPTVEQELVHRIRPTTHNITAIRATLKELKANGSTNLGDALDKAMSILSDRCRTAV